MTISNSSNRNGPSTLADRALKAWHERGMIFVRFASGHEVSFPTKGNPRLESATEEDVGRTGRRSTKTCRSWESWKDVTVHGDRAPARDWESAFTVGSSGECWRGRCSPPPGILPASARDAIRVCFFGATRNPTHGLLT
jgi:hypothetical protein